MKWRWCKSWCRTGDWPQGSLLEAPLFCHLLPHGHQPSWSCHPTLTPGAPVICSLFFQCLQPVVKLHPWFISLPGEHDCSVSYNNSELNYLFASRDRHLGKRQSMRAGFIAFLISFVSPAWEISNQHRAKTQKGDKCHIQCDLPVLTHRNTKHVPSTRQIPESRKLESTNLPPYLSLSNNFI